MKHTIFMIALMALTIAACGQTRTTEADTADYREFVLDSTLTRNGKIVQIYYHTIDRTPRVIQERPLTLEQVDQVLGELEIRAGLQRAALKAQLQYVKDSVPGAQLKNPENFRDVLVDDPGYKAIMAEKQKFNELRKHFKEEGK